MYELLNSIVFAVLNSINDDGFKYVAQALEEIYVAYRGGDYGYVALDNVLHDADLSRSIVSFARHLGK